MKRAVLYVSDILLGELFKFAKEREAFTYQVIENPIPADAKVVRTFQSDEYQGALGIVFESEAFEEMKDGEKYPELATPLIQQTQREV